MSKKKSTQEPTDNIAVDTDETVTPASDSTADASGDSVATENAEAEASPISEIEKVKAERDELHNRYLRAVADLDNYRRRVMREKDELRQFAVSGLVESLLPVLEHLGLAIASAQLAKKPEDIATGVAMVQEQFRSALTAVGLTEIKPEEGGEFDPHQHESLSHTPSDTVPEDRIASVIRVGFSLNQRIIRPASVVLSSGPAADSPDGEK